MLVETKARVGVFAIALGAYLQQFPSLVPEFEGQFADFKKTIPDSVELVDGGIVTTKEAAMVAGDKFRAADVDLVILQMLTYATSYNMLPAIRDLNVPVVLVNVQKKKAPDYANTDTALVRENMKKHNPKSPFLLGESMPEDVIHEAVQKTWIDRQLQFDFSTKK